MKSKVLLTIAAISLAACNKASSIPEGPTSDSDSTGTEKVQPMTAEEVDQEADKLMMENPPTETYTLAQVAKHATPPDDCWIVIDGKVYDVSGFAEDGHGGGEAVYEGCGIDATELYDTRPMGSGTPHSEKAEAIKPNFYIGDLVEDESAL